MRRSSIAALVLCSLGLESCGVSMSADRQSNTTEGNACQRDTDCPAGLCAAGVCQASSGRLSQLLVEMTEPAGPGISEYGNARYLYQVKLDSGRVVDLSLDALAELSVGIRPPSDTCELSNLDAQGYLPIRLTVTMDSGINGIKTTTFEARSAAVTTDNDLGNLVQLSMPPAWADIYIEPLSTSDGDGELTVGNDGPCDLAPLLTLGLAVNSGGPVVRQRLPQAEYIDVDIQMTLQPDAASPMIGWVLDLVDPLGGRRLSSRSVVGAPKIDSSGKAHHTTRLAYHSVIGRGAEKLAGTELFRLTPPDSVLAPTYYYARSATDLFDASNATLPMSPTMPTPVVVNGQVESEVDGTPVRADIVAVLGADNRATAGSIAAFRATTSTDQDGRFAIKLLAGNYQVYAVPAASTQYGTRSVAWSVAPSPAEQAGKVIQVGQISALTGVVLSQSSSRPLANATVSATRSSFGKRPTFLDELLGGGVPIGVRSQTVRASTDGTFKLPVDLGRYDVTVWPADGSGYPWRILPSTIVDTSLKGLQDVRVRDPVVYGGAVTIPGPDTGASRLPLPGAILRFFALYDENGQLAEGLVDPAFAVQIGETRADDTGSYRLSLPESLD